MLLRGSTFLSSVFAGAGVAEARWRFGAKAVQVYSPGGVWWSRKALIARNAPFTIEAPHLGQLQGRINFGEIARRHKGERGFREGLPIIAFHIKTERKGFKSPDAMRPEDYPSRKFHTVHTLEQLKRMEREKRAAVRAPGALPVPPGALPP
jgi:hypothetical protein